VPVLAVSGESLDAVLAGIRRVGERLGRGAEAGRLADDLSRRRQEVRRRVAGRPRPRALLLVWPDPPQAAGAGTFLAGVLEEAAADNLGAGRGGWPVLSAEFLATAPVSILVMPDSPDARPAFEKARASGALSRGAAATARVLRVPDDELSRPG